MVNMAQQQQKQRQRMKLGAMLLNSDHQYSSDTDQDHNKPLSPRGNYYNNEAGGSPYATSPWSQASPFSHSPWATASPATIGNGLIGSLVREEGHVYSLAVSGDLLYTGSDSKNIRVWKNLRDFTGFKSNSGLVKSIVIAGEKIFTGHQDGKIRVWRVSRRDPEIHRRIGSLPSLRDTLKSSVNPKNYVKVRRKRNVLKIRHFDAVSSMSLDEEDRILYSASWDRTVKAWSIATSKCLDSFSAHDDAVNAVAAGLGGLVFTGSADGKVKAWRRLVNGDTTEHVLVQTLLTQESAVTALTVARDVHGGVLYCGSSNGAVNFWELHGKRLSHGSVFRGHNLAVLCLAAAGNLVLSGGADKIICAWRRDRESGAHECVSVLTGHAGPVKCLAVEEDRFDADGDGEDDGGDRRWIVYSGSLDRSVKVWRVSEHAPELKHLYCASEGFAPSPNNHGVTRLGQEALLRHQY